MKISELYESFNSRYPVQEINKYQYTFTTDQGKEYKIYMEPDMSKRIRVTFYMVSAYGNLTKFELDKSDISMAGENPTKILSTVANVVIDFVRKHEPDLLYFAGLGKLGMVYRSMSERLLNQAGYSLHFQDQGGFHYTMVRKD